MRTHQAFKVQDTAKAIYFGPFSSEQVIDAIEISVSAQVGLTISNASAINLTFSGATITGTIDPPSAVDLDLGGAVQIPGSTEFSVSQPADTLLIGVGLFQNSGPFDDAGEFKNGGLQLFNPSQSAGQEPLGNDDPPYGEFVATQGRIVIPVQGSFVDRKFLAVWLRNRLPAVLVGSVMLRGNFDYGKHP